MSGRHFFIFRYECCLQKSQVVLCNIWCTYVNCGWHDSAHIRTLPLTFLLASRFERYYLEYVLRFVKQCTPTYVRDICCDPLKSILVSSSCTSYRTPISLYSKWRFSMLQLSTLRIQRDGSWYNSKIRVYTTRMTLQRVITEISDVC